MTNIQSIARTLVGALAGIALAACGGSVHGGANLNGKVSDRQGSQAQQALTSDFGGSGTVSSASRVTAYSIGSGGTLTAIADASVAADGSYSLAVPDHEQKLIVVATSSTGAKLASVIVDAAGTASAPATAAPMDSETSVEANVLVEMVAQGTSLAEANSIDLRTRINQNVAAAVRAQIDSGEDASASIAGLARAVAAAQQTWIKAAAQAGVTTTQSALFDAELSAAQSLDASLASGSDDAQAYSTFFTAIDAAQGSLGADEQTRSEAESQAGSSFNLTVHAEVGASANAGGGDVDDAAQRQEAVLCARLSTIAVNAILSAGSAASSAQSAAVDWENDLKASVSTSTSAAASASAFAAFSSSVSGSADLSASVLGLYLGVTGTNQATVSAAVSASASAAATLHAALDGALTAAINAQGKVDPQTLSTQVASAFSTYATTVQGTSTTLISFGSQASAAADLLVVADGSFHAAN